MNPLFRKLSQTLFLGGALALTVAGCDGDRPPLGALGPDVGLFLNGDYVGACFNDGCDEDADSDWAYGDEGSNLFVTLAYAGYNPLPFTSIDAGDIDEFLAGKGAIVIPEQEDGSLAEDLSDEAAGLLATYVQAGGLIVINGTSPDGPMEEDEAVITATPALINRLLGTSVSNSPETDDEDGQPVAQRQVTPVDTIFDGGPDSLPSNNGTYPLLRSSLPAEAAVVYGTEESAHVVIFPHGNGAIVFLAYNWSDAAPAGEQDEGWLEVLGLALEYRGVTPPEGMETVALFLNSYFVDVNFSNIADDEHEGAEGSNLYHTLTGQGYHVAPWTEPYEDATGLALFDSGARVVIVPENEDENIADYLDDDSWDLLYDFVYNDGGTLIVHSCSEGTLDLIQDLIEDEIDCDEEVEGPIEIGEDAIGTSFDGLAGEIPAADATDAIDPDDLDGDSLVMYWDDEGYAAVVAIPYGYGAIVFIGFDWYNAAPVGSQDDGWLDALNAAIQFDPANFD